MNGKQILSVIAWVIKFHPRSDILLFLLSSCLLVSCSTSTPQPTPEVVSVYSTSATSPWLSDLYDCAAKSSATIRLSDSSSDSSIRLQIGESDLSSAFAYQIDTEEILIVTHRQSPIQNLTLDQARTLFAQGDPSVQVWVYASGEDVQKVFDQLVMEGRSVTSSAKVAVDPQQMSDTLVSQSNAVGILPRHWKAGDVREVFSVATVPVLAITQHEPQGVIKEIIVCLQK